LGVGELDHLESVARRGVAGAQRRASMMVLNVALGRITSAAFTGSGL
jgi:hypothetical protein